MTRTERVAYGLSSVGQPVKRVSLKAPHSGPENSGTSGAASLYSSWSLLAMSFCLDSSALGCEFGQQGVGLGVAEAVVVVERLGPHRLDG